MAAQTFDEALEALGAETARLRDEVTLGSTKKFYHWDVGIELRRMG